MGGTLITALLIIAAIVGGIFVLTWLTIGLTFALALFFCVLCVIMTLFVLIQKPKGGGLSGAFGGGGGSQAAVFGAKTGDALTVVTVVCFLLFLVLGVSLVYSTRADQQSAIVPTIEGAADTESGAAGSDPGGVDFGGDLGGDLPPVEAGDAAPEAPTALPEVPVEPQ